MRLLFRCLLLLGSCVGLAACTSPPAPDSAEDPLYLDSEVGWNWKTNGESQVRRYLLALDPEWSWVYRPLAEEVEDDYRQGNQLVVEIENSLRVDTATETHKALMFAKLARVCVLNLDEPGTYDSIQITYNEGEWTRQYAVSNFSAPAYWLDPQEAFRERNGNPLEE